MQLHQLAVTVGSSLTNPRIATYGGVLPLSQALELREKFDQEGEEITKAPVKNYESPCKTTLIEEAFAV